MYALIVFLIFRKVLPLICIGPAKSTSVTANAPPDCIWDLGRFPIIIWNVNGLVLKQTIQLFTVNFAIYRPFIGQNCFLIDDNRTCRSACSNWECLYSKINFVNFDYADNNIGFCLSLSASSKLFNRLPIRNVIFLSIYGYSNLNLLRLLIIFFEFKHLISPWKY